ncbi:hypothetical protein M404DRAFT_996299 [Pisolithus tinctorius Marx 270]|uniref:Uncharacterized protein n=1 Tax=Pisolithus tinctorius Marx 270 TaxID=870435 RepID=A0A0C3PMA7_PISTI|nr:hypothetical protein M404DRAFT_996299 [Pisolithus tinctorius Marx 270]
MDDGGTGWDEPDAILTGRPSHPSRHSWKTERERDKEREGEKIIQFLRALAARN